MDISQTHEAQDVVLGRVEYLCADRTVAGKAADHLAHVRNMRGSWLVGVLDLDCVSIGMLIAQWIIVLPCFVLGLRYYAARKRRSLWVDAALVFIVAGIGGALLDLSLRGYILDFINLPGLTTADLKDIFLYIGAAALFAEFLENEVISLRWLGWRVELEHTRRLIRDFLTFSIEEARKVIHQKLLDKDDHL